MCIRCWALDYGEVHSDWQRPTPYCGDLLNYNVHEHFADMHSYVVEFLGVHQAARGTHLEEMKPGMTNVGVCLSVCTGWDRF